MLLENTWAHHFTDGVLGSVQLLTGPVDEILRLVDPVAGLVSLVACRVHCVPYVLQPVPLSGQSVVYVAKTIQQALIHICRD